jgi:putative methyltransferase (TIGR04325 family)
MAAAMAVNLAEYEFVPEGWRPGDPRGTGWDHPSVARAMRANWPQWAAVVNSTRPLGIYPMAPHIRHEGGHNLSMTFAYVLARAAHGKTGLSVLDWGGALGHYALMAKALLPEIALDITIKERPEAAATGRTLVPFTTFVTDDADCFSRSYDVVVASGSLQYAADWRNIAGRLVKSAKEWMYLARLPLVRRSATFVVVQRPYLSVGYQTEYLSWVFNRDEFLAQIASSGAVLEREFISGENVQYAGGPEISEGTGFLFRASTASAKR